MLNNKRQIKGEHVINKKCKLLLLLLAVSTSIISKPSKIVGLMQIYNEQAIIAQALKALSLYTDAIIVLDDASDDRTVDVVQSLASSCNVEKIIKNKVNSRLAGTEGNNYQQLLEAGRLIGGTHFMVIDADELLSANCAKDNFLRRIILRLNPGDKLKLNIVHYWKNLDQYRIYFDEKMKYLIFCDDGQCSFKSIFLHVPRVPFDLAGGASLELVNDSYCLLHFAYVNWDNVLLKQIWYRCLERIRNPSKSADEINYCYRAHKEEDAQVYP